MLRIRISFRRNSYILLHQSLSHAVRVTAPFTQGSLRRSRARGFIDTLNAAGIIPAAVYFFLLDLTILQCHSKQII